MLTCRELIDFLADYVAGELPRDVVARFDEHLAVCPPCVRYLEGYRAATAAGQKALREADAEIPPAVPDSLVSAVLASRKRPA